MQVFNLRGQSIAERAKVISMWTNLIKDTWSDSKGFVQYCIYDKIILHSKFELNINVDNLSLLAYLCGSAIMHAIKHSLIKRQIVGVINLSSLILDLAFKIQKSALVKGCQQRDAMKSRKNDFDSQGAKNEWSTDYRRLSYRFQMEGARSISILLQHNRRE